MLVDAGMRSSAGLSDEELCHKIAESLEYINFHRFEAYWKNHIRAQPGRQLLFYPGTYWEDIMMRYMFDQRLRRVVFDALACIEVALRTLAARFWSEDTESDYPHRSSNNYSSSFKVGDFLFRVNTCYRTSGARDVACYRRLYGDVRALPVGIFVEFTSFGNMRKLLSSGFKSSSCITSKIAAAMGMSNDPDFFLSGISLLNDIRNSCAHQARIWNRRWLSKSNHFILGNGRNPLWDYGWDNATRQWIPGGKGEKLVRDMDTTAAALTFSYQLMKVIAPHSQWRNCIVSLFTSPAETPKRAHRGVGFSNPYWMKHPLWM